MSQKLIAAFSRVDPKTGLEAFMLAAVGSNSKLESVYGLLKNHPAALNPYVGISSSQSPSSNKRKGIRFMIHESIKCLYYY